MTAFRKFMVHNYFGERWIRVPFTDRYASSVRQGSLNMITLLLLVALPVLLDISQTITGISGVIVALWILWTGFQLPFKLHYFGLFPVKWEELKNIQKWYYGRYATSDYSPKDFSLNSSQLYEYWELSKYYKKKFNLN